jgi:hypothetical protein
MHAHNLIIVKIYMFQIYILERMFMLSLALCGPIIFSEKLEVDDPSYIIRFGQEPLFLSHVYDLLVEDEINKKKSIPFGYTPVLIMDPLAYITPYMYFKPSSFWTPIERLQR